jgi:hypothetical protein
MKIDVVAAIGHKNGFFLCLEPEKLEDFWLFLGPLAGWGRFSLVSNRIPGGADDFELVEIRLPGAPAPEPVVEFNNVLWRKKEAAEILDGGLGYENV